METTILIYAHLALGTSILCSLLFKSYKERPSEWVKEILQNIRPQKKSIGEYLLEMLAYLIAAILIVTAWPFFLIWIVIQSYKEGGFVGKIFGHKNDLYEEYPFNCRPENLICEISPIDAEEESKIYDPLNTTPDDPFGHLNIAWLNFLGETNFQGELWKFEIYPKENTFSNKRLSGYAWLYKGKVISEFLVEC